jgi:hypothetical protein
LPIRRLNVARTIVWGFALAASCVVTAPIRADLIIKPPPRPVSEAAMYADQVVLGRVVEVEKETVGARRHPTAPKAEVVTYRLATLRVDETLVGTDGRTRVRVGFPDGADSAPVFGAEGVFFLDPHHSGDFHVLQGFAVPNGMFLSKADPNFDKALAEVRRVVAVYADPVAALKAKDKDARLFAAKALLWRYYRPRFAADASKWPREDVPPEENKLLLKALAEMPWVPADGDRTKPCLAENIYMEIEPERWGFKVPSMDRVSADKRPYPLDRLMEEDLAKFLIENADKVKLKRYVPPKPSK